MTDTPERPDPDELLRRVHAEDARANRGRLKDFGFAPGVGKTYRMLEVARDFICDQHLDVVVGLVETHRRTDTSAMPGSSCCRARPSPTAGRRSTSSTSTWRSRGGPRCCCSTSWPTRTRPARDTPNDGRTSRNSSRPASTSTRRSTSTSRASTTWSPRLPTSRSARRCRTRSDAADDIEVGGHRAGRAVAAPGRGQGVSGRRGDAGSGALLRRGPLLALRELALRRTAQHVDDDVLAYREAHGSRRCGPPVSASWSAWARRRAPNG